MAAFSKPGPLPQVGDMDLLIKHESHHRLPNNLGAKNGRPGT